MTRKLTAEQLKKLIGFHRSPRAAQMRRSEIRVFTNNEDYVQWRRERREEYLAERKRHQESESDQQDDSEAKQ
ncbi:MAG: hypothetical protein OXN88_02895 [Chloroflexota bacterium]|nr:hypothetical protein [Chloroflexota bacterium]